MIGYVGTLTKDECDEYKSIFQISDIRWVNVTCSKRSQSIASGVDYNYLPYHIYFSLRMHTLPIYMYHTGYLPRSQTYYNPLDDSSYLNESDLDVCTT